MILNMYNKNKRRIINIAFFLGLLLMVSGHVFTQLLSDLDEVWVYNFARCITNGLLPYKDISMIITPLFPYICAMFLKIFGNELIVLRCLECFEIAILLFMIYKILRRIKVEKWLSLIFIIRTFLLLLIHRCIII